LSSFLDEYDAHVAERAAMANGFGVAPKPLDANQVNRVISELKENGENDRLLELLVHRVPPGVDEAAYVKATWLSALAKGVETYPSISRRRAVELLGTMQGGYNVATLVGLLKDPEEEIALSAADQLSHTLLVFDAFYDVQAAANEGRLAAQKVLESWSNAEWFLKKPKVPDTVTATVFKVTGETNTDDLSPAQDAWSRPDIPLHAVAMLKNARDGIVPEKDGEIGPLGQIAELKKKGHPLAYVGDVVGTGSSRKSATNSVLWHMGHDIPYVPNVRGGGLCLGGKIAPIFFNTMEDSGALPIELDVQGLNMGDVITVHPYEGKVTAKDGSVITEFQLKTRVILDEVRAGGRIP
jgi:aconitate hydratase 2/2-methylisocitrate dehydratase